MAERAGKRAVRDKGGQKGQGPSTRPRRLSPRLLARKSARLGAVQALYQMDVGGAVLSDVLAEFATRRIGERFDDGECGQPDLALLEDIVRGVVREQVTIDRAVNRHLVEGWKLPRLDATVRAILRAGGYELMFREDIPPRVTISEYVDVARAFFDDGDEPRFVNGVLDALARERRADELHA